MLTLSTNGHASHDDSIKKLAAEKLIARLLAESDEPKTADIPLSSDMQARLVSCLLADVEFCKLFKRNGASPSNWVAETDRLIVKTAIHYFDAHGTIIPRAVLKEEVYLAVADKEPNIKAHYLSRVGEVYDDFSPVEGKAWLIGKFNDFCQQQAIRRAMSEFVSTTQAGTVDPKTIATLKEKISAAEKIGVEGKADRRQPLGIDSILLQSDQEFHVDQHFGLNSFVSVFGPPEVQKSFYCLNLALCVGSGLPFLGKYPVVKGHSLYILGEGQAGLKKRVRAWLDFHHPGQQPDFAAIPSAFDLCNEDEAKDVLKRSQDYFGHSPTFVVVDTLARNYGGSENDGDDMQKFIASVDMLRAEAGATVCVIHHTGKDVVKKLRGHSSLPGAADAIIELTPCGTDITVCCEKQKDFEHFQAYNVAPKQVELGWTDKCGKPVTSLIHQFAGLLSAVEQQQREDETNNRILGRLALMPDVPCDYYEAAQAMGLELPADATKAKRKAADTLRADFNFAAKKGWLVGSDRGGGKTATWTVTAEGKVAVLRHQNKHVL